MSSHLVFIISWGIPNKQDLRDGFNNEKGNRERLLLTMAVPAGVDTIELGYDIRALNRCAILFPFF